MKDRIINHIDETIMHKQYVLESARILSRFLIENNCLEDALELVKRCTIHDNSKFSKEEIEAFINVSGKSSLKDPRIQLDDTMKKALSIHWKNNTHHPEHYLDYNEMSDMDIMEMACDWYARSMEYNTDLLEFVVVRQEQRFHFSEPMFNKLYGLCLVLVNSQKEKAKVLTK